MVRIYFIDGKDAEIATAVDLKFGRFYPDDLFAPEHFQAQDVAIVCLDSTGREVGRFRAPEVRGYAVDSSWR